MKTFSVKFSLWMNIAWAILIVFNVVGLIAGHDTAAGGLIRVVAYWVSFEIINRALASWELLKLLKLAGKPDEPGDKKKD